MYKDYHDYEERLYEPTELDELMREYLEKCKTILLSSIQSEINLIKECNSYLEKSNNELKEEIKTLKELIKQQKDAIMINELFSNVSILFKEKVDNENDRDKKEDMIFDFLSLIFEQNYSVSNEYTETPLWIKCLTAFYSHKYEVIGLLKTFKDIRLPDSIENFRLPVDWNEEELDIFFANMDRHINTNHNVFEGNLRWYGTQSLKTVKKQCEMMHTQIPWQFVLRNPLLKQPKYLNLIGNLMSSNRYRGDNVTKICKYQNLSDDEIKMILNSYIVERYENTTQDVKSFLLENLKLITDKTLLDKIYDNHKNSYDFQHCKKILEMPFEYLEKFTKDNKKRVSEWIIEGYLGISNEQKKQLKEIILE